MAAIKNITGVPPEVKWAQDRKVSRQNPGTGKSGGDSTKLHISTEGRELLEMKNQAENEELLAKVHDAQTLDEDRLETIRQRIVAEYYDDPKVIEKILEELLNIHGVDESNELSSSDS